MMYLCHDQLNNKVLFLIENKVEALQRMGDCIFNDGMKAKDVRLYEVTRDLWIETENT